MNKKIIFIIIICLGVLAFGGVGVYFLSSKKIASEGKNQNASEVALNTIAVKPKEDILWDDPAGFTFKYSPQLTVNKHDEDEINYAHVELTNTGNPGNIIVWAKDTTASDVKAWVKTEKTYQNANIIDTTLGGQPAKKVVLSTSPKKIITGVIYDELLFIVEGTVGDNTDWNNEYQKITDNFQFKPTESSTANEGGNASSDVDIGADEEETLE
jgi:hypothetical protein